MCKRGITMENPYKSINELKTGKITTAQKVLFDGLIKLWKTKPIYKISVKELTEVSNVARSTFYVYYKNINELIEDIENYHISQMMHLNEELMNTDIKSDVYLSYYQETINYVKKNKDVFYAFLIANINNRFIQKWKDGMKYHLLEREYRLYNADNYNLILEMVASQVISGYTFWLTNPNDVNINGLAKIVSQTLRLIEI